MMINDGAAIIDRVGFACVTYQLGWTTNHSFRLANLSSERLAEAVARNLDDLEAMLGWMAGENLRFLRIGSSFVPFASHASMKIDWKSLCAERLRRIGREYGASGFRFSMHPGQYNVLNSPSPEVLSRTVAELSYSCGVLDLMGLDGSHKVVIHAGGVYGDRKGSLERLCGAVRALPDSVRARLAIENDDRHFTFEDVLSVCEKTGVAAVYDHHHQQLNPSGPIRGLLERARPLWGGSRPEVHLSSQKAGARPGAHDFTVRKSDLMELLRVLPFRADLMVEAKGKERAALDVLGMLREIE